MKRVTDDLLGKCETWQEMKMTMVVTLQQLHGTWKTATAKVNCSQQKEKTWQEEAADVFLGKIVAS